MEGRPTIQDIQRAVCEREGLDLSEIRSARRERHIAWPRQVAMALAWELSGHSYATIGKAFGGRCMATVYLARKKITRLERRNPRLAGLLNEYRLQLKPGRDELRLAA
jgi:chromosomal replication initiator protein